METNNNKKLDLLFEKARNEAPKTTFLDTKQRFLSSIKTTNNGQTSINGKANFLNLKNGLIMIFTISTITVGIMLFTNSFSLSTDETSKKENIVTDDSVVVVEEHQRIVNEYLEKIKKIDPDLTSSSIGNATLELVEQDREPLPIIHILDEKNHDIKSKEFDHSVDTAYRFPNLDQKTIKAQKKKKTLMLKQLVKFDKKKYAFIPSGVLENNKKKTSIQSFYIQTTEVTNLEYRTFLFDLLLQNRKDEFLMAKPDQSRWVKDYPYAFNEPMEKNYFSHPAYNEYPVVAISREGAEMYCNWLIEESKNFKTKANRRIEKLRIPSDKEWEYAALGGLENSTYPWGGAYLKDDKGCYLANYKPLKNNFIADGGFHTVKVDSYNPNDYGLYCMSGNAAEMVYINNDKSNPGTKGGSWSSVDYEIQINGPDKYKGMRDASVNIGFRPVITYAKKMIGFKDVFRTKSILNGSEINKDLPFPGTLKINDNLYFDETEITNLNWREYLSWQEKEYGKESDEYKLSLPDTTVWKKKMVYSEPYVKYYFRHSGFNHYPVVGISYEQAIAFCKWRTDRVKELHEIKRKKNPNLKLPTNFKYRLPTKIEWEEVAQADYTEKKQKKLDGKYEGQDLSNLKRSVFVKLNQENSKDEIHVTIPVHSYWPNRYGVYNIIGNVAEMIDKKGVAKGGSWIHTKEESTVEQKQTYTEPKSWLGFRPVCEIKE